MSNYYRCQRCMKIVEATIHCDTSKKCNACGGALVEVFTVKEGSNFFVLTHNVKGESETSNENPPEKEKEATLDTLEETDCKKLKDHYYRQAGGKWWLAKLIKGKL